ALEQNHQRTFAAKRASATQMVEAMRTGDDAQSVAATAEMRRLQREADENRRATSALLRKNDPLAETTDTNYVFLTFVINNLPVGLVGLLLAAVFCAAMSATASGLNSLASTTVVDIYRRLIAPNATEHQYVRASKLMTVFWGVFAVGFAEFAGHMGSLIEAVNKIGSYVYGTILAIFLLAFYTKHVGGRAAFVGAIIGEIAVVLCSIYSNMAWLWWNVVGCVVGVVAALIVQLFVPPSPARAPAPH
ncbi:MAG TPA: sodium:solute symporter, partial [Thermoanaerobaculia bacterium]